MSGIEFGIDLSPTSGVAVTFKLPEGADKAVARAAVREACDFMRIGLDEWEAWSEENATPEERRFKQMAKEQREAQLEQWEEIKHGRAQALAMLDGEGRGSRRGK